jgi:energy-coupling factor transporter ATP-binding protein EcfA2
MADYADLNSALEQQLNRTARFVRAAFHVHSIDSHDWGKQADPTTNNRDQFTGRDGQERYLDALANAGLQLVCVTDHMKSNYAFELAALAAARDDITVFPGMEISCLVPPGHSEAIHILVIYPPDASADVIERLFAGQNHLPGVPQRTGIEQAKFASLTDIREMVDGAGGLFMLAHIDQLPRGHRCFVRSARSDSLGMFAIDPDGAEEKRAVSNEYAEYLIELAPNAVEVRGHDDRRHYWTVTAADGSTHTFACIAKSDHHSIEAMSDPNAVTHVKLSRRDITCVRDAMLFHATRVRFGEDLPATPSPRLIGMRLRGGGLFSDATIAFNENLNCLIGPRGCGKSTIVEALRYVLGQRPLLEDPGASGGDDRSYASLAIATQDANLKNSEIELIYEHHGERHVLAATYDPSQPVTTRVFTLDGNDCRVAHEQVAAAYPVRIFSWSELETLGRQPRLQRLVVDRLAEQLPTLQEQERTLRTELIANRERVQATLNTLTGILSENHGALRRWTEHSGAYDRLNTSEIRNLFGDLDHARAQITVLQALDVRLTEIETAAERLDGSEADLQATSGLDEADQQIKEWWEENVSSDLDLAALEQSITSHTAQIAAEVKRRRDVISEHVAKAQEQADSHETAIREQTNATPDSAVRRDQREQARAQLEISGALRERYQTEYGSLQTLLTERGQTLKDLDTVIEAVGDARVQIADELASRLDAIDQQGPKITIDVEKSADRSAYERYLDDRFLNLERGGRFHARGVAARLAQLTPTALAWAISTADINSLVGEELLDTEQAARLLGAFTVFEEDADAGVTVIAKELLDLLELQEQPLEDLVTILSDNRPVHELSPGGRSSAMLPLIALSDEVPLIIDQPEDNLDNRMVGQTLSSILARLKEHRQIIVTTHNPNIVVGGDAEQVVVLDAPTSRSAQVETTGNIDRPEIIDAVIKIMEGGREAFQERSRRYGERVTP